MNLIKNKKIFEIEALRGIAAFAVVLFHYTSQFRDNFNYSFSFNFIYGHYGVELFFMISGFVIFMSLENITSVGDFLFKRFARLYPTYWICLTITIITIAVFNNSHFSFSVLEKLGNFLMFQQFLNIKNIDGSYWSLLPELCFYCLIIFFWKLKFLKHIIITSTLWLLLMYAALLKPSLIDILLNLKFGMYFLIGMMFYKLKDNFNEIKFHLIILASLITVYFVKQDIVNLIFTIGFTLLFYLLILEKLKILNNNIFIFLGTVSYPLYLLHQTIGYLLIATFLKIGIKDYLAILITIILIIFLSWLVYNYLEKPVLKLIKSKKNKPSKP